MLASEYRTTPPVIGRCFFKKILIELPLDESIAATGGGRVAVILNKILLITFVACLSACSPPTGDIRSEYSRIARQVGVVPVYPPTENIQVGDIYAMSLGPDPADVIIEWVGELDEVAVQTERFMAQRIVFRQTSSANNALAVNQPTQTDTYGAGLTRRSDLVVESLPIEAFPSVTANAGFALGAGSNSPGRALGLGFGQQTQVTIDYTDVRSYGLPRVEAARKLNLQQRVENARLNPPLAGNAQWTVDQALRLKWSDLKRAGLNPAPMEERCIQSIVVTRVFLTRQINYTFSDAQIAALSQARAVNGANATAAPDAPAVGVIINNSGDFDASAVEEAVDTLAANVASSVSDTGSSSGVTFEGFTALGAKFRQVFQRPVVIGWEGWPVLISTANLPPGFNPQAPDAQQAIDTATESARRELERCNEILDIQ